MSAKKKQPVTASKRVNPLQIRKVSKLEPALHVFGSRVVCTTDSRGHSRPGGAAPAELVLDASEGFIPLWAKDTTLRWRFQERSFRFVESPGSVKSAIQDLFAESLLAWGDAAPVKFVKQDDVWDFQIVMRRFDDCDDNGCVLASAFFPDGGRHELVIYPKMFELDRQEQVDTLTQEIGHIFGLRHFFANVSETAWPSQIFGTHSHFSIMNYGKDSKLTSEDKSDLKRLYQMVWGGDLTEINGTPIRLVQPYHTIGLPVGSIAPLPQGTPIAAQQQPIIAYTYSRI